MQKICRKLLQLRVFFNTIYNNYLAFLQKGGDVLNHPTMTIAETLLEKACRENASDIHFYPIPNTTHVIVYFRLLGKRTFIKQINRQLYQALLTYFKFSSNMDIAEIKKPQNGTSTFVFEQSEHYSLRLSTLPLKQTESLTIRLLPQTRSMELANLFLFPEQFQIMKNWMKQQAGMLLFTGPTGSGKSTTMYALLETMMEEESCQAITLEDPIEKEISHLIQVEVNERAGVTYQSGLKAALRHDPDVLMIGEIRDPETAKFAFQAALTGHLVLSTLHAKDATSTIDRLIDLGIKRVDIAQSLLAVAAMELLPVHRQAGKEERAAIVELLEGEQLEQLIQGKHIKETVFHTFNNLRERAYQNGYISRETYEDNKSDI